MLSYCLRYVSVRRSVLSIFSLFLLSFALGCSGGSSDAAKTTAPANLVYPQTTITVTAGQAIPNNTPTVTGTVTSYSISPALPAGLTLNTSTGAISGTPTAAIASTTFTITASNSTGSTSTTIQITVNVPLPPPSGLSYSPSTISATVGQAITSVTPTVTGTVSSYSVAPALPAGISLGTTTGAISGTPTAATAQATYVVTATNASGSTTASLQITVNAAVVAPSALSYPQTAITGTVGQPIAPNIPSFTGSVTSFTISPALPAGMSLNTSNGTISGTPTAVLAQASYTVTASNAGGNTTAALTLVVDKAYATVLELGHADRMTTMRSTTDRLLSQDRTGHWALWDAVADSELASGDQYFPDLKPFGNVWDVDLAGPTVAIGQPNGLEIRSSLDGHLLSIIAAPRMIDLPYTDSTKKGSWWKLASDGSYICAGSAAGLSIWSPGGQQLVVKQGDYSSASVFAAPGQVQVALGAAGQNVIETINIGNGASAVGPAFSGTFNAWFLDGQRFLTNTGNTVWTYSAASVQQGIVSLPSIQNLAGQGNWISTYSGQIAIYAVGASTPSATYQISGATVVPSGMTLGIIINPGDGSGSVVDLSGSAPVKTDFTTPFAYLSAYTATSASKWFAGNVHGVIVDGASANAARALSLGQAWSIAGGTTKAAISTANGSITYLNPATPAAVNTIAFSSSKLALSTDDTVLAALANSNDFQYQTDRTLNVYSLPSGTTTISFPYSFSSGTYLLDFSLSGSGSVLGQILSTSSRTVSATTGGTPIWSDTFNPASSPIGSLLGSLQISPDGTLIAAASGPLSDTVGTNIYKNGALVTAVPGWPLAWLDDSRLLVKSYTAPLGRTFPYTYASSAVYDSSGAKLATPAIPELLFAQPVGSGQIYSSDKNSVFSLATGSATWTGGLPSTAGAVAGQYVIFAKGSKVFLDAY